MTNLLTRRNIKKIALLLIFISGIIFTRTYNLDQTARFTQDESSDLARMRNYYQEKKITLVGPISSCNTKVFSSLSYYMVMPMAALANFDPIGPVYGTAFWGIMTAVLLLILTKKINPDKTIIMALLLIVWYPLLEMSRWAWNPHFVVFWAALGLLAYEFRTRLKNWGFFFTGLFLGFLFHHHYLSFFPTATVIAFITLDLFKKRSFKASAFLVTGYIIPHLPFLLFDLRHPPGLFITRYLLSGETPHVEQGLKISALVTNLWRNWQSFLNSIVVQKIPQYLLGIGIPLLAIFDLKNKSFNKVRWLAPALVTIVAGVFLNEFPVRYIYPALTFFLFWILLPRKDDISQLTADFLILTILISALFSVYSQLTTPTNPDLYSFTKASKFIEQTIKEHNLDNANVAALASRDPAPLADTYRDVVRMNGAGLRASSEYELSEHLFVVSTSSKDIVRQDESYAMIAFEDAHLKETFNIPDSEWRVHWFGY